MSKSQIQAIERKQIKNIYTAHQNLLSKCLSYAQQQGHQLMQKQAFQQFQRYVQVRIDVLDYQGLVELKAKIINSYNELMDLEHDLSFEYYRQKNKKCYFKSIQSEVNQASLKTNKIDKTKQKNIKKANHNQKRQNLPVYTIKTDSMTNKIDSINNFVVSLKSSMKRQTQPPQNLSSDEYLLYQPEFIRLRQQFQRCRMAEQDMLSSFNQRVQQQSNKILQQSPIIQQNQQYKIIKVCSEYKKLGNPEQLQASRQKQEIEKGNMILQQLEEEMQINQNDKLQDLKRKVDRDFEKMLEEIEEDIKRQRHHKNKQKKDTNKKNEIQALREPGKLLNGLEKWSHSKQTEFDFKF